MGTDLTRMIAVLGVDAAGVRDRALLLVGWFGALRRSELVGLDIADVAFVPEGAIIRMRRSKTDQEGRGISKALPTATNAAVCPVRALRAWIAMTGTAPGPLFRAVNRYDRISEARLSDRSVARIVQRTALAAGVASDFAGHSLRAGFATTAAKKGRSLDRIMRQTGHRSERIARGYIRYADLFSENAAHDLL